MRTSVIVLIVSTTTRLPHAIDIMNLAEKFNVSCHNPLNMGSKTLPLAIPTQVPNGRNTF